jgi:hypothetical protein
LFYKDVLLSQLPSVQISQQKHTRGIMIDCALFNVKWQLSHAYPDRGQIYHYIDIVKIWGRTIWTTTLDCYWKRMESWVGTTNIPFYSGYNVLTFWQIYKRKRSLTCSEQNVTYYGPIPWWNPLSASTSKGHTGHLYGLSQYAVNKFEDIKRVIRKTDGQKKKDKQWSTKH